MENNEEMQTQEPEEVILEEAPVAEEKPAKKAKKKPVKKEVNYKKLYQDALATNSELLLKLQATENLLASKKAELEAANKKYGDYSATVAKTLKYIDTNVSGLASSVKLVLKGEL